MFPTQLCSYAFHTTWQNEQIKTKWAQSTNIYHIFWQLLQSKLQQLACKKIKILFKYVLFCAAITYYFYVDNIFESKEGKKP